MADLIIQSTEHFLDSPIITFRGTTDLVVAEAYHEHYGDASSVNTLYVNDIFHDHTSLEIKRMDGWYFLTIASCDQNVATPNIRLNTNYHLWMDESALLPQLKIDAWSGIRINCPPAGLMLPALELDIRAGARLSKRLPTIGLSASGHGEVSLRLNAKLPCLQGDARAGIRARTTLRLPVLTIEATGLAGSGAGASLSKTLPGLTIEAHGYRRGAGDLAKKLPALTISATGVRSEWADLAGRLPAFMISATGHRDQSGSLNENLPTLQLSARGVASSMQLAADLPTLVMNLYPDGQTGGGPGRLTDADRFDDYVMRYVR